jgi:hypothetical protein
VIDGEGREEEERRGVVSSAGTEEEDGVYGGAGREGGGGVSRSFLSFWWMREGFRDGWREREPGGLERRKGFDHWRNSHRNCCLGVVIVFRQKEEWEMSVKRSKS